MEMEKRRCAALGCGNHFTVLATSTQKYHSTQCAKDSGEEIGGWYGERKAAMKKIARKEELASERLITQTRKGLGPSAENATTQKLLNIMNEESDGPKKTKSVSSKPKENTTPEIKSESAPETKNTSTEKIQREVSIPLSDSAQMVTSPSMHLLDTSAEFLHGLMKKLDKPGETTDTETVHAACNLSKNIREIMKLKLDCIKVQQKIGGK